MAAAMIGIRRFREAALRLDETVDSSRRILAPLNVKGTELGIELEMAIRKVVVNPPRKPTPICAFPIVVNKPRDHNAGCRSHPALVIPHVPDVIGRIGLYTGAKSALRPEHRDLA